MGSSQDCKTVSNSIRERVIEAKISVGMSILTGIISNEYVAPTKHWTVTWPTVNSIWWPGLFYHALEWCKSFLVHQGENKRLGSSSKTFHRRWKTRKKNLNYNFQLPAPYPSPLGGGGGGVGGGGLLVQYLGRGEPLRVWDPDPVYGTTTTTT